MSRDLKKELVELKAKDEAPEFLTEEGYITLVGGYLLPEETPKLMYKRVAKAAAIGINKPKFKSKFFEYMWKGWLCPATPVLTNLGTDRGLPVSCFTIDIGDSIKQITEGLGELSALTKEGGGVGIVMDKIRPRGALIKGGLNGVSSGVVPFIKMYDSTILGVNQGSARRGSASVNLNIEHGDWEEFIRTRRPEGDVNRQCHNIHQCTIVNDSFMHRVSTGDSEARRLWTELMRARMETGESYIFWKDKANLANPEGYKKLGLEVTGTNICCLSGDTRVATNEGSMKIDTLVNKDVLIFDGNSWVNNNSFELMGQAPLYRIWLSNGDYVDCTDNHRWFISKTYEEIRRGKLTETLTSELEVGDYLEYQQEEFHGEFQTEGAYLKGFMIGDGTCSGALPILRVYDTKYDCLAKLIASALEVSLDSSFRSDAATEPSFTEEYVYTSEKTYGRTARKTLKGLSSRKTLKPWAAEYKTGLPEEVFSWSKQCKLEFLSGLFDSDGTLEKTLQITLTEEQTIRDIQKLLSSFNVNSSIDIQKKEEERKTCFRLTVSATGTYKLLESLDLQRIKGVIPKPNRELTTWRKIKALEKLEGLHNVYCPKVESTGKFALANGLMTGNSEITLHTDEDHSFICCLSSLNIAKWDEWKNTDLPQVAIYFLNGVLNEFISKSEGKWGLDKARRSAVKGRALGLGVLGWHTLLQSKMIPFEGFATMQLNNEIFSTIKTKAVEASKELAVIYGEPEWCKGTGQYNSHLLALAPTRSNSIISGDVSFGIEPIIANAYLDKTHKGKFSRKNKVLKQLLEDKGKDTDKVWNSIQEFKGSVQHLSFLSDHEKSVFKTAYEIDQKVLVQQASQRGAYICQAQSLNLFFPHDINHKYFNDVHLLAYELPNVKTLYYCRSMSGLKITMNTEENDCKNCEG